mgnify:CR=1 FL=1
MQVKDNVFVITGGGRGLGRGMAESLAKQGGKLALIDLNQTALDEAVASCKAIGGDAKGYIGNITDVFLLNVNSRTFHENLAGQ